jgi:hypothetical protein
MSGVLQEMPNWGARKLGRGSIQATSLEVLKYLATRATFHHSGGPEIRCQTSFSPKDEFIRLGSLMARPPLLKGWKTSFHLRRWNFFVLVFPPAQRKLQRALEIFFENTFGGEQAGTLKDG